MQTSTRSRPHQQHAWRRLPVSGDGRRGGGHRRHDDGRGRPQEPLPAQGLYGRARRGRKDQLPYARRAQRRAGGRVLRAQDRGGQDYGGAAQRWIQPHEGEGEGCVCCARACPGWCHL